MAGMREDDRGADDHAVTHGDEHVRLPIREVMPPLPHAHAIGREHGVLDLDKPRKIGIARAADADFGGAGGRAFRHGTRA